VSAVRKAVIPAAGLGTRFLPATKAIPKEMLPVVDRPSIQYVVEEAVAAGLDDILIITGRAKSSLEDHFDRLPELEAHLADAGKDDRLTEVVDLAHLARVHFVRQQEPLGLGHAVSVARDHVGDEPFAVLLGDDFMVDGGELLRSMIEVYERFGRSCLALLEVTPEEISAYGAATPEPVEDGLVRVHATVEKPAPADAPSNLAVIGHYVFTPAVFDALERINPGVGGEFQLTDAIDLLCRDEEVYGRVFSGGRYDIGRPVEFLRANIELALERPEYAEGVAEFLTEIVRERGLG